MTPTLFGRIQTRIFTCATVGGLWTLIVTPFLPRSPSYKVTFTALGLVALLGVVLWEPIYHFLQQFRWEKDWPAMFILLEAIPEGVLVYLLLPPLSDTPVVPWQPFVVLFVTTWLAIFVFVHGPIRVPFLRWRFRGGRFV